MKPEEAPQFHDWNALRKMFTEIFASKTQSEWCSIFDDVDACVTPVLTTDEALRYPHNTQRQSFDSGTGIPVSAPRLSETPGSSNNVQPDIGEHTVRVLTEYAGYSLAECQQLIDKQVVEQAQMSRL